MGVDILIIIKVIVIILCVVSLSLIGNYQKSKLQLVTNVSQAATDGYITVLIVFLAYAIFETEADKEFSACIMICGAIFTIGAGIAVCTYYADLASSYPVHISGACLCIAAGVVMIIDAINCINTRNQGTDN